MPKHNQKRESKVKNLIDGAEIVFHRKVFTHYYSYVAPTINGNGGGTSGGSYSQLGFTATVRNTSSTSKSYEFRLTLFQDIQNRIVKTDKIATILNVQPGYTKSEDIELHSDSSLRRNLYLEEIRIIDSSRRCIDQRKVFVSLSEESYANMTEGEIAIGKAFYILALAVLAIIIATAIGIFAHNYLGKDSSLSYNYSKNDKPKNDLAEYSAHLKLNGQMETKEIENSDGSISYRFMDGSRDEDINKASEILSKDGTAPLNSLTLPMLFSIKSGYKSDYTVISRLGRNNFPSEEQEAAQELDNPVTEEARIESAKRLLPFLNKQEAILKSSAKFVVPLRLVSIKGMPSQRKALFPSRDPGHPNGIYCSAGGPPASG